MDKPYEFRKLNSTDIFTMTNVIKKLGIKNFIGSFDFDSINKIKKSVSDKEEQEVKVGINVMLQISDLIISNLNNCENEIYKLLSNCSNLTEKQIKNLDIAVFLEMIVDFINKDEFVDFMKVVSKLLKKLGN